MRLQHFRGLTVWSALSLALGACGGGGGGGAVTPTYSIGGAVSGLQSGESVVLVNNGTDALTVNGNNAFTFATQVDQGGSYDVTVKTQPKAQNCTVMSGSGSAVSATVNGVMVSCKNLPQYAYVVNNGSDTVSQYAIDAMGTLSPLTVATVATGHSPQSVTLDPTRKYVYVPNLSDDTVSQYVIQSDGTLAPNTPATVAAGHGPWAMAAGATGSWMYVVNSVDGTISQFSIGSSGSLVATNVAPVPTGVKPWHLTLSPDGKYAYVSDHGNSTSAGQTIHQYGVDSTTGALTALNPATVPTPFQFPGGIAVDPTSAYVYLSNINDPSVAQFGIGSGGGLSPLNPASVAAGTEPVFLAFDPSGKFAYEMNYTLDFNATAMGTVSQYGVGAGGQLTPLVPASVAAGVGPAWVAFDAFGKYAYVTNIGDGTQPGTVSEYAIGADGTLTSIGTINAGVDAYMIATAY